jgi:hypothetical protein
LWINNSNRKSSKYFTRHTQGLVGGNSDSGGWAILKIQQIGFSA